MKKKIITTFSKEAHQLFPSASLSLDFHRSPVINADTLEIDFSAVDTYLRCAKQYEFRYVQGIKSPPGIALIEGSSHHAALEMNNLHKRDKGRDLKAKVLTEKFEQELKERTEREERVEWGDEKRDVVLKRAKMLHERYINDVAPLIKPVGVEKKFEKVITIDGKHLSVYGTMDVTTKDCIRDYKAVSRMKSQGDADSSLQLSLYAWAEGIKDVGFICLVKKANPEVGVVTSRRNGRDVKWALQVALKVAEAVQKGSFPLCDPAQWVCSEKFCGYWDKCRGKR